MPADVQRDDVIKCMRDEMEAERIVALCHDIVVGINEQVDREIDGRGYRVRDVRDEAGGGEANWTAVVIDIDECPVHQSQECEKYQRALVCQESKDEGRIREHVPHHSTASAEVQKSHQRKTAEEGTESLRQCRHPGNRV